MEITYIKLKNVIGIYRGMGMDKLEISFPLEDRRLFNLISGTNGSGKTTFTQSLEPFANEKIRKEKKGYKEIHFKHKKEIFIIRHFYEPNSKGSHTCKSFIVKIDKNGVQTELNPNGNVTSFKEIVAVQLGVTPESLKLLKLGVDMVSMIGMTPLERKKFITNFTSDTDIYLYLYRKVNDDHRILNKLVKNYADKLNVLGNLDNIKDKIELVEEEIRVANEKESNITMEVGKLINDINKTFSKDDYDRLQELSSTISKGKKIKVELELAFGDLIKENIVSIQKQLDYCKNNQQQLKDMNSVYRDSIETLGNQLYDYRVELSDIELEIDKLDIDDSMDVDKQLSKIDKFISENRKDYKAYKEVLKNTNTVTIIELFKKIDEFTEALNGILDQCEASFIADYNPEHPYMKIYLSKLGELQNLDVNIDQITNNISEISKTLGNFKCDNKQCPLLIKAMGGINSSKEDLEIKRQDYLSIKPQLEKDVSVSYNLFQLDKIYKDMCDYLKMIDPNVKELLDISDKKILKSIRNCTFNIKDNDKFQHLISVSEMIDQYDGYLIDYQKLQTISNNIEQYNKLKNKKSEIQVKISNINSKTSKLQNDIEDNQKAITKVEGLITNLEYLIQNKPVFDSMDSMVNEYEELLQRQSKYSKLCNELDTVRLRQKEIIRIKEDALKERDKLIYRKKEIKKVTKQKKLYEENIKDVAVLRDALSTNKGIPLIFVSTYLERTRDIANRLIKDAFDGELELGKFQINDKEFSIPLIGRGEENEDISTASAGERSIISLALSLALVEQNSSKYNILIMDELDAPLDSIRRRRILNILEKQVKRLKIKQIFNITHNDLFNDYPLNLILFKGANMDTMGDKNVIFQY